jgi:regulator of Ty1 transposition protein 103
MRKKEEFLKAFEPILPQATEAAYKGSPSDIQNKIRRVVEVWRQRRVFNDTVQVQVEDRLKGMLRQTLWLEYSY